jgi:uncharacterized protein YdeI (YjbR/CyaY-like superfamily)
MTHNKPQFYFKTDTEWRNWLSKNYIKELSSENLIHKSGLKSIEIAKENDSWNALNDVDNLIIPNELQIEFDKNIIAFNNYQNFAKSYKKGYLYWLNQAKREVTRQKRITEIIRLCKENIKSK